MATFPTFYPSTRTFTPGEYPHTPFQTLSARNRRVLHSNVIQSSSLRLSFVRLSESDMLAILSHYNTQQGDFIPFAIPASILQGFTAADFIPTGYLWRYAEPPEVEDFCGPYHDVTVVLESVGAEAVIATGLSLVIVASMIGGAAALGATATGAQLTITATLTAGPATGNDASTSGVNVGVALQLLSGGASSGVTAPALTELVATTLAAGAPETSVTVPPLGLTITTTLAAGAGTGTDAAATGAELQMLILMAGNAASASSAAPAAAGLTVGTSLWSGVAFTGPDETYFNSWGWQHYGWDADLWPEGSLS